MTSDSELLRQYLESSSNAAFGELVQRYLGMVYSAALRQVGGSRHLAEETAQEVFLLLARKAPTIRDHPVLAGWLHTSTRLIARGTIKNEARRIRRENDLSAMENPLGKPSSPSEWDQLRPVIDEVLGELEATDRQAVLLRFFSGHTFLDIGTALRLNEDAARKRVHRALDKLHAALARRGILSTSTALAIILSDQAAFSAPAGLAVSITGSALAGAATASLGAGASITTITTSVSTVKLQLGLAALIVAAGATVLTVQSHTAAAWRDEIANLRGETQALDTVQRENRSLAAEAAEAQRLRQDDAGLAQLRDEIEAVKARQGQALHAEASVRQARNAFLRTQPLYSEKDVDQKPRAVKQVPPTYPAALKKEGVTGTVVLSFVVTAEGEVADVQIVKSSNPEFAKAATEAVEKWRYDPGKKGGDAVNVRTQLPITFSLSTNPQPMTANQIKEQLAHNWF